MIEMKKLVTVVVSLVVLVVFILPITTSAQQTMTQKDSKQDKCDTKVVKEVSLTPEMLQLAQEMGILPKNICLATPAAACNHTYSAWKIVNQSYESSPVFGRCLVEVNYESRYCTKCSAAFGREVRKQLEHIFVGTSSSFRCKRCGMTGGSAR